MSGEDWKTVDAYLFVWSKFQPGFRVVFRMDFEGEEAIPIRELIEKRFPLVSKKDIVKVERVRHQEPFTAT